jgi:rubrerythrin
MSVYAFAMQMETDAEQLYQRLAESNTVPGIRRIFAELAADEHQHLLLFQRLQAADSSQSSPPSTALENAKNIFAEVLAAGGAQEVLQDDLESYRYAMEIEAKGVRFYEDAIKREQDAGVKAMLRQVADEERKHFNIVENIYRFANAPNEFLAWGEFSNIDEFHAFGRDVDL